MLTLGWRITAKYEGNNNFKGNSKVSTATRLNCKIHVTKKFESEIVLSYYARIDPKTVQLALKFWMIVV